MVSTRRTVKQNRRLLSQLDEFDAATRMLNLMLNFIGDAATSANRNVEVYNGSFDRENTVNNDDSFPPTNENTVNVQTLERCVNEGIDWKTGDIVETLRIFPERDFDRD